MVLRRRQKLTQAVCAQRAGISKAYLVLLENQGANASLSVVCRIARALQVEVGELFSGDVSASESEPQGTPESALKSIIGALEAVQQAITRAENEVRRLQTDARATRTEP